MEANESAANMQEPPSWAAYAAGPFLAVHLIPIAKGSRARERLFHAYQSILLAGVWLASWLTVEYVAWPLLDTVVPVGEDWLFIALTSMVALLPWMIILLWPIGVIVLLGGHGFRLPGLASLADALAARIGR